MKRGEKRGEEGEERTCRDGSGGGGGGGGGRMSLVKLINLRRRQLLLSSRAHRPYRLFHSHHADPVRQIKIQQPSPWKPPFILSTLMESSETHLAQLACTF